MASGKTYKAFIKMIEPRPEHLRSVPFGIGGDENYFELLRCGRGHILESLSDHGHLQRAHIRAVGVSEVQKRCVTLRPGRKIEGRPGRVGQYKSRFRQW